MKVKVTKENVKDLETLLDDLAHYDVDVIENVWCVECGECTIFYYGETPCEDCGSHLAVRCDSCGETYDSIHSRYEEIKNFNCRKLNVVV